MKHVINLFIYTIFVSHSLITFSYDNDFIILFIEKIER